MEDEAEIDKFHGVWRDHHLSTLAVCTVWFLKSHSTLKNTKLGAKAKNKSGGKSVALLFLTFLGNFSSFYLKNKPNAFNS